MEGQDWSYRVLGTNGKLLFLVLAVGFLFFNCSVVAEEKDYEVVVAKEEDSKLESAVDAKEEDSKLELFKKSPFNKTRRSTGKQRPLVGKPP